MADNETNQGGANSVLGQQAKGDTGRDREPVPPFNPTQAQGEQPQGQTGAGQDAQQGFEQQGQGDQQGVGTSAGQLGENKQTYGASTRQDTSGGLGPQQANLDAQGQTGVLGAAPAQSQGQPASASTGGPNLAEGLRDQNSRGGS